ncbi:hypothetical protein V5799_006602 [Amblyomma americanum]|uniref:Uncharacterized protein n=1 Tax=Amblyomma americanum TaxID=6943 RepID=A0AAQ4DVX5_AMBAM
MEQPLQPAALEGARGDAPVSARVHAPRAGDHRRQLPAHHGTGEVRIVSRPANWRLGTRVKVVFLPVVLDFTATALIYMTTTQWKRIQRGNFWRTVTLDLAPYRSGTGQPLLKIGNSATFRAWIALMRAMSGQGKETPLTLRYRKYIRSVLGLFGVSESRAEELAAAIQEMDLLTLDALGPAMADPEQKILRMSIHNMTATAAPGIPTGRWLPLLNEYFAWARLSSANNEVQLENPGLLRAVAYLRVREAETREALTLSLRLPVVTELGWMADK